jgi:hypothetical protein
MTCSGESQPPSQGLLTGRLHAGLSLGVFGSELTFGGGAQTAYVERRALSASLDLQIGEANTISIGGGAGLGGLLRVGGVRHEISPGWLVTAAYSRRLLDGRGAAPFLLLGVSLGGSGASTRAELPIAIAPTQPSTTPLFAFDLRAGLTVGKTFFRAMSPYASARVFGGPVIWSTPQATMTGSDQRHFQLAVGLMTALPRGFDLYVEAAPLGERALTIGGGARF